MRDTRGGLAAVPDGALEWLADLPAEDRAALNAAIDAGQVERLAEGPEPAAVVSAAEALELAPPEAVVWAHAPPPSDAAIVGFGEQWNGKYG